MVQLLKKFISSFFSRQPKFYTIPFGPIKGKKLFTSFQISPRMLFGFDETWVAELASKYIQQGDTVYDVGAHIGYTSLLFAKLVGNNGKVHAFELLPSVSKNFLEKTVKANQLENVIKAHPIGLSDQKEEIVIYVGETMMGTLDREGYETQHAEKCITESLDQYLSNQSLDLPKLIKVDIERAEIQFLKGAATTLETHKPILIIEFHNIDLLREGFEILSEMGYQLSVKNGAIDHQYIENLNSFYGNTLAIPHQFKP
ncbi:FkbM family methyltransferase [Pedobacter xixiisoli]|uniref:Methyltransferase, FkbM family n=1 Tax=Pedobacter xixiisoli TaxID=1476464 RepID=A0A286AE76_9SPHI|nr:FkbM family methyltransferase [Pedobacter xixiisoli]SOD20198.1 methyltransferase, FkbM family [Pedobacter xixiisoli]